MIRTTLIEACARAAHEAHRSYCLALGDTTQPSWENLPTWERSSVLIGVGAPLAGDTPEQAHESWMAEKRWGGWVYGPAKDPEKKQHPRLLPYDQLPRSQRQKDELFWSVVRAMAVALGQ